MLHRHITAKRVSIFISLLVVGAVGYGGTRLLEPTRAATNGWTWQMSNIHGAGTAQVIVADPVKANYATVGGDSWGIYNTKTAGDDWLPAMKGLGQVGGDDVEQGDFFYFGMAYSEKFPGRVYGLTGKLVGGTAGGFGYSEGNAYKVVTRSVSGTEGTGECGDRTIRPRCTGNRVVIDYDATSGIEYIYIAEGNGRGIARSTNGGVSWTTIAKTGTTGITGMALDPEDPNVLYVGTRSNGAFKISSIRAAGSVSTLTAAPNRVEEMATIGNNVYAVAHTSGVYKLTNGGTTWAKLGGTFFSGASEWAAIGGSGNTLYVGGANTAAGKTIAKSSDGGASWKWVPASASNINITPWGTTQPWWLAVSVPRVKLGCFDGGCTYESTSIAVDKFNPDIVYSAGRSGVWKSMDGGANWRPSVNHLAGSMHTNLAVGADGKVTTDDVDWIGQTSNDNFETITKLEAPPALGTASLTTTKNGRTYEIKLTVPRDITLDGVSIADEYFKAAALRPRDIGVSDDGKYIYIAQFGGGILIGKLGSTPCATGCPDTKLPAVTLAPIASPAAGTVPVSAAATDNIGVTKVEFYVDNVLEATDTSPPYTFSWNTAATSNGSHTVTAKAYDAAGNNKTSSPQTLSVSNTTGLRGDCSGPAGSPDGRVNVFDLSAILTYDAQRYPPCDFDTSGDIGAADMSIVLARWTW